MMCYFLQMQNIENIKWIRSHPYDIQFLFLKKLNIVPWLSFFKKQLSALWSFCLKNASIKTLVEKSTTFRRREFKPSSKVMS